MKIKLISISVYGDVVRATFHNKEQYQRIFNARKNMREYIAHFAFEWADGRWRQCKP